METSHTLRTMLARGVEYGGERPAIIEGVRSLTFLELAERTNRMGNALLSLGLAKGDRVAILSRNSVENAEAYFSIPGAGLVLVMLNFRLSSAEMRTVLDDAGASVLMVSAEYRELADAMKDRLGMVRHFIAIGSPNAGLKNGWLSYETLLAGGDASPPKVDIEGDDLAALMYTSGTTGAPKGCMISHGNFYHVGRSMARELGTGKDDVCIIPTALFHAAGLVILMNGIGCGIPSIIMPQWDAEDFMWLIDKYQVSIGVLATPMLLFFVNHPQSDRYRLGSLRQLLFAGAPVTPVIFQRAIERFGNIFIHGFGTTETTGSVSILRTCDVALALVEGRMEILGSCGTAYADIIFEVVRENGESVIAGEVGEIRVRGEGLSLGYWHNDEETARAFRQGWYYTGDLGRQDEYGMLSVVGRKKDMIITGGENVFPAEVENVLYRHPDLQQVAVIGIADAIWGEMVAAFVVCKEEAQVSEKDLKVFCRQHIAGYKVPKKIVFIDSLPLSASGKVLKSHLKQRFSTEAAL